MTDNTPDSETSKPGLEDAAIEPEDAPIEQPPQDADEFEPLQPSAPLDDDHDVFDLPTPTTKPKGRFLAACAFLFALVGLVEVIGGGGAVFSLRGCASPRRFCVVSFWRRVCRSAIE